MKRKKSDAAISRRDFTVGGLTASAMLGLGSTLAGQAFQNGAQSKTPTGQPESVMPKLSRFIANTRYDAIPSGALDNAKIAIMDSLGVAIAGAREESAEISGRLVREERAKEEAIVYGQRFKSSAMQAAFVNGTA